MLGVNENSEYTFHIRRNELVISRSAKMTPEVKTD